MRIAAIDDHAMKLCILGVLPDMPDALDRLCDAGWIDEQGSVTGSGRLAWDAHVQVLEDEAILRNVLPSVRPDTLVELGRLAAGEELSPVTASGLDRHPSLVVWMRAERRWKITERGRRAVELSHMRTY